MTKWSVGIVTAPRQDSFYLNQTVFSLDEAGWSEPVIFAEPGSQIPSNLDGDVVFRRKRFGDWTNWATGFYELLLSEPDTDYFLMAEDDVVFCKNARLYIEHCLPILEPFASLSLYTPSIYHKKNYHGFHNELHDDRTWSTVTVIMSRSMAISFFSCNDVQRHRFEDIFGFEDSHWCCPNTNPRNSIKDAVLGRWASKIERPIFYHTPSLAEHIGDISTITDSIASVDNGRKSQDFVGINTDVSDWIARPINVRRRVALPLL